MRKKAGWVYALVTAMALTGCASSISQEESSAETVIDQTETVDDTDEETETETEEEVETTEAFTDYEAAVKAKTDLISDDYMSAALKLTKYANINAVADVMKKAEKGEKITIACIGGSITQGTITRGASDSDLSGAILKDCYANIFKSWWEEAFPDTEVEFINAGIGATGSYLAVHRVQKDVLDKKPDLVLVEFSVNDAGVKNNRTTYENLVRAIRESEGNPAVMMLMMSQTNYSSAQTTHQEVGLYYNLPMISYGELIRALIKDEVYTAEDLSGDTVHPSSLGHTIVGEVLWKYLNDIYAHKDGEQPEEPFDSEKEFLTENKYLDCTILDNTSITPDSYGTFVDSNKFNVFPNDWTSEEGDGEITFTTDFKNLGIMYYCVTNGSGAKYDVYVDDTYAGSLNADFTGGWGNYAESTEVYASEECKTHKIVLKKNPDSKGEAFTILGLLISK